MAAGPVGTASASAIAPPQHGPRRRLLSLDAFRGFTVAAMIFVSSLGDQGAVGRQLTHASWHGTTFRDVIAPFFLFAMGAGMAFAFARYTDGDASRPPYRRITRRGLALFGVGLLVNIALYVVPDGSLADLRIMGVLQRIAVAYLITTALVLTSSTRTQMVVGTFLLISYEGLLRFFPVPGHGSGVLTPEGNVAGWFDRLVMGSSHLHRGGPYDPEGLLSTLPAVATVLLGYWTGQWLRRRQIATVNVLPIATLGALAVAAAVLWGTVTPLNKALWTPSYVLLTAGWAWLCLAVLYTAVESWRMRRTGWTLAILGRNALFAFTVPRIVAHLLNLVEVSGPAGSVGLFTRGYQILVGSWAVPLFGDATASVLYGLLVLVIWWFVHLGMYRKQIFLRL